METSTGIIIGAALGVVSAWVLPAWLIIIGAGIFLYVNYNSKKVLG